MDGVEDALERPIGPLPLWGWLAVGIVGVGIMVLMRRAGSGSSGGGGDGIAAGPPGAGAIDPANDSPNLTADAVNASIDEAIGGLVDYGNAHWLADGGPGGSGGGTNNTTPIPTPAVAVAAAPVAVASRPYAQHAFLGEEFAAARDWFLRSDTPTGLGAGWQDAPEDARQQLRSLIGYGYVTPEPTYGGARPV